MKNKVENLLKESLIVAEKKFGADESIKSFEEAQKQFKDLISKGVIKERGNNLLSPSDYKSFTKVKFNIH